MAGPKAATVPRLTRRTVLAKIIGALVATAAYGLVPAVATPALEPTPGLRGHTLPGGHRPVGRDLRRLRLVAERWPVFLVASAFYLDGYPVWQVFVLSVMTTLLTEVAFAVVRVLLLDREY